MPRLTLVSIEQSTSNISLLEKMLLLQKNPPDYEWIVIDRQKPDIQLPFYFIFCADILDHIVALQDAIRMATGDYIWILSKDVIISDMLCLFEINKIISIHMAPDIICTPIRYNGVVQSIMPFLSLGIPTDISGILIKRSVLDLNKIVFNPKDIYFYFLIMQCFSTAQSWIFNERIICDRASALSYQDRIHQLRNYYQVRKENLQMNPVKNTILMLLFFIYYILYDGFKFYQRARKRNRFRCF